MFPSHVAPCVRDEQWAYDQLRLYWGTMTDSDKAYVIESIGTHRGPSRSNAGFYRIIEQIAASRILDRRMKAAREAPPPKFRY